MWFDVVKDYDCELMSYPGKANVVVDAMSRKAVSSATGAMCMRISIDSSLLDLITEAQVEAVKKENWKHERLMGEVDRFPTDSRELLTRYGRVWVPNFGGIRQTILEVEILIKVVTFLRNKTSLLAP